MQKIELLTDLGKISSLSLYKRGIYSGCVNCLTSVEGHKNPIDRMKAVVTPEKEEEID